MYCVLLVNSKKVKEDFVISVTVCKFADVFGNLCQTLNTRNKIMKCYMILVLAVVFSFVNCNAQGQKKANEKKIEKKIQPNKVKYYFLSQLDGTEWLLHEGSRIEKYVRRTVGFTKTERIFHDEFHYHPENNQLGRQDYYLSDTIPTSYDEKYVGKVESGRYIVYPGGKYRNVSYLEIQKLTEDSLVLFRKYVPKPRLKNEVIFECHDVIFRYSRINKSGEEFKQVSKGGQLK